MKQEEIDKILLEWASQIPASIKPTFLPVTENRVKDRLMAYFLGWTTPDTTRQEQIEEFQSYLDMLQLK
jgi:hypothetical protein